MCKWAKKIYLNYIFGRFFLKLHFGLIFQTRFNCLPILYYDLVSMCEYYIPSLEKLEPTDICNSRINLLPPFHQIILQKNHN